MAFLQSKNFNYAQFCKAKISNWNKIAPSKSRNDDVRKKTFLKIWETVPFYLLVFGLSLEPLFTFSLTFLLLDGTRNFPSFLNALLVAFFLHFEIGNEGNNIMANVLAGFLVVAKFHRFRFLTIGFGRAACDR